RFVQRAAALAHAAAARCTDCRAAAHASVAAGARAADLVEQTASHARAHAVLTKVERTRTTVRGLAGGRAAGLARLAALLTLVPRALEVRIAAREARTAGLALGTARTAFVTRQTREIGTARPSGAGNTRNTHAAAGEAAASEA